MLKSCILNYQTIVQKRYAMKYLIDSDEQILTIDHNGRQEVIDLYSDTAFEFLSQEWIKIGWNQKYIYSFTWMGRPVIQLPEDMLRIQEVIFDLKPDVIIETGVAHGGSLVFYASLCKAMGKGRIIGIDIDIRSHNRKALEEHFLFEYIDLIEGGSTDEQSIAVVESLLKPKETILVILDSNHSYEHVTRELEIYSQYVSIGSYIVATDGVMRDLEHVPRGVEGWATDNPSNAAIDYVVKHQNFEICQPPWPFNESTLSKNVTHWPNAWLKRVS